MDKPLRRHRVRVVGGVLVASFLAAAAAAAWGPQPPEPQPPQQPPETPPAQPEPQPQTQPQSQPPTTPPAPSTGPQTPPPVEPPPPEALYPSDEPREAIITLKDGQRYTGFLVERDNEKTVLRIAGINTTIPSSRIDRMSILPPIMERYRLMRAAIADNDADGLLVLVEWLRTRAQWDPALTEVEHVLKFQPDNGEAKRLRTLIKSQRDLALKSGQPKAKPRPPTGPAAPPTGATGATGAAGPTADAGFPVLSDSDINVIKVYEVNLADPPRMVVDHETIRRLIEEHAGDPLIPDTVEGREAMLRLSPARILDLMFRLQARNLYGQVKVLDHPHAMRLFRDDVHRIWLINACATTRCHGGAEAGRLMLDAQRASSDAAVYTNFLILDRFRTHDGKPLINYDEPAASILLQMALPREVSKAPHPVVPATEGRGDLWRPFFKSPEDRRFGEAVDWIKAMYHPRPQYPVQYTPPSPQAVATPDPSQPPVPR